MPGRDHQASHRKTYIENIYTSLAGARNRSQTQKYTVKLIMIRCGSHGYSASAKVHALRILCSHMRAFMCATATYRLLPGVIYDGGHTQAIFSFMGTLGRLPF